MHSDKFVASMAAIIVMALAGVTAASMEQLTERPLAGALALPIQWMVAGPRAIVASAMTLVFGFLRVEALLRHWRRIPFTCSYMPGKHMVAQSFIAGLGMYLIVSTIGGAMETASLRGPSPVPGLVIVAVLSVLVLVTSATAPDEMAGDAARV